MSEKLLFDSFLKLILGIFIVALLLFCSAGTMAFINGWLLILLLFVPMLLNVIALFFYNPKLLKKRLQMSERDQTQKTLVMLTCMMFVAGFVLSGLNFRFSWHLLPKIVSLLASIIYLLSYVMYVIVLKTNPYLSRSVEIHHDQKLVSNGVYSVVRHPMYSVSIILFMMMPLILGSLISFFVFLLYPVIIVFRIRNEEKLLCAELDGYSDYMISVKYRLFPFIW